MKRQDVTAIVNVKHFCKRRGQDVKPGMVITLDPVDFKRRARILKHGIPLVSVHFPAPSPEYPTDNQAIFGHDLEVKEATEEVSEENVGESVTLGHTRSQLQKLAKSELKAVAASAGHDYTTETKEELITWILDNVK